MSQQRNPWQSGEFEKQAATLIKQTLDQNKMQMGITDVQAVQSQDSPTQTIHIHTENGPYTVNIYPSPSSNAGGTTPQRNP